MAVVLRKVVEDELRKVVEDVLRKVVEDELRKVTEDPQNSQKKVIEVLQDSMSLTRPVL